MSSNIAVLTKSHNIIAAKKRARKEQIKEIVFDEGARRDFLTGFHKRKLQKKEEAKKKAQDRDKQERLDTRREKRQLLAEQAVENAEQVERAYRKVIAGEESDEDEDEDTVFTSTKSAPAVADEEYEDEEQLATVTVIEDFDPDTLIHGPGKSGPAESARPTAAPPASHDKPRTSNLARNAKSAGLKKSRAKTSTRSKDIKYETKADRNVERTKQRARKTEKASLAGGKGSRKKAHGRGKR